ncbi:GntR family transcriptional regulator [Elioraea sp. Yellowstone]|jgi:DNA-binding GntR family transcriptional regulator|uniref:GntR family transcriptional regulator n=1 Tax=Elioraea sp. Yellowstone TaxID=2592070 RepID=UPI00114DC71A|nr:GntR family transcriptional regulator [Elioraea sp. Yellowstone]TQF82492.1 GntR family transcriptional regulator [Elioraea sp. Yellowstone]
MTRARRPEEPASGLAGRITEDILFGRLLPRERLVEDDLVVRFGATRHAVRAALQALAREGLVVHHRNRGAQVRSFTPEEVEEITEVRELLHAEAARRIPLPASPALMEALTAIEAAHAAAVARGDLSAIHAENDRFHETLFAACGNRHLAATIRDHARLSLAFRCHAMADPALAIQARDEHRAMLDALRRGDREALVRLCVNHTSFAKRAYRRVLGAVERAA